MGAKEDVAERIVTDNDAGTRAGAGTDSGMGVIDKLLNCCGYRQGGGVIPYCLFPSTALDELKYDHIQQ